MYLFKLISFLPLWVLYIFTDILYLIGYHLLKYRQKVIFENLAYSFPEKSEAERKAIAKKFFRTLTDSFAETIRFYSMTPSEVSERFKVSNSKMVIEKIDNGEIVILVSGHFINWEGQVIAFKNLVDPRLEAVYLRINNPFFDRLMQNIRGRFGGTLVEKAEFSRNYLKNRKTPRAIGLGADQRPTHAETRYSAQFMNRKTAFFEGPEKLAKRYGHAVFYGHIKRPKRGHYSINYELIAAPPYDNSPEHSITDLFIKLTEKGIREQPEIYLWSHNRWK
ncbi:lysophospholipid acyltransferase family protein [Cognataquiflexum rubidum]|uniref:lysophospholipid acyltransferase family protein n=1 Tax=Cognataquiflexum rubidum TaxID=2922273 RepID=UPI001F1291D2|nr:lipid A biosynthesis acyltransferase [Cognataquiflexum rubidum]MCH6234518.1 lipid A biosynthesis acyltransferase [Cognataquiflexum rubidum]